MIGNMINAAIKIPVNDNWLELELKIVKLYWNDSTLDGITNGNNAKPTVKTAHSIETMLDKNAKPSLSCLLNLITNTAPNTVTIGANHIQI